PSAVRATWEDLAAPVGKGEEERLSVEPLPAPVLPLSIPPKPCSGESLPAPVASSLSRPSTKGRNDETRAVLPGPRGRIDRPAVDPLHPGPDCRLGPAARSQLSAEPAGPAPVGAAP